MAISASLVDCQQAVKVSMQLADPLAKDREMWLGARRPNREFAFYPRLWHLGWDRFVGKLLQMPRLL
jgi:hypothetical protein